MSEQIGRYCHSHGITGFGDPKHGVLILGLSPGAVDVREGKPLVGPTGKLLDATLKGVGWPRERTYCTYLVCHKKDEPDDADIMACSARLDREIREVNPHLIVTLGAVVATEFFPDRTLGKVRGGVFWNTDYDCFVLPTYHPAAVLRGSQAFVHDIVRDLAKIPDVMAWPRAPRPEPDVQIITDPYRAQIILNTMPHNKPIGLDIETSYGEGESEEVDLFSVNEHMLSVAVSDGEHTFAFPFETARQLKWPTEGVQWAFHNGMFDAQGMRKYLNAPVPIVHDTMLASYNLDERGGRHGLKSLAREYVGAGFWEEAIDSKNLLAYDQVSVLKYNGYDAAYTAQLVPILHRKMAADDVLRPYRDLLLPAANAFTDICLRGVHIDRHKVNELGPPWYKLYLDQNLELLTMAKELGFVNPAAAAMKPRRATGVPKDEFDYAGHPDMINLGSPKQLSHLLYDVLGLPAVDKRKPRTTDKAALEALEGHHPFIDKLLAFRKLDHMIGNYILGIGKDRQSSDLRLHPQVLLHGTRTGRLSYRNPPLQTIPQSGAVGGELVRIREIFAATDDDHTIIAADYGKAEVYCASWLSGDEQMMSDLQHSDFHTSVAAAIFNVPYASIDKNTPEGEAMRWRSKKTTFGIFYGSQAPGLAMQLKIPIDAAQTYIENFMQRYHKYHDWYTRTRTLAQKDGELVSATGRKRRFVLFTGENVASMLNQAVNFPVQALASDVCLSALIELHTALRPLDGHILLSVHDAIYVECPRVRAQEVAAVMHATMTRPRFPGMVGIPVEIKMGQNLGQMTDVKVS